MSDALWLAVEQLPDDPQDGEFPLSNILTNDLPTRAVTFQSVVRTSSPWGILPDLRVFHPLALEDGMVTLRRTRCLPCCAFGSQ